MRVFEDENREGTSPSAADTVDPMDTADFADPADSVDPMDTADFADPMDSVDPVDRLGGGTGEARNIQEGVLQYAPTRNFCSGTMNDER